MPEAERSLQALVAQVAASYFTNAHVAPTEIPAAISQIADSLSQVGRVQPAAVEPAEEPRASRAQMRKSITPDALISFEDGKRYKTLRRHLSTRGLSPAQYREKWGLPSDYPMVAPSYSAARSALAKELGLGQKGRQARRPVAKGRRAQTTAKAQGA